MKDQKTGTLCVFLLMALIAGAYHETIYFGFVYDDNIQIIDNPWLTSFSNLYTIFTNHSFGFLEDPVEARSYRPFVFLIYMVEYAFFGLEPMGWHMVNVILHAANSFLLYIIALKLISPRGNPGRAAHISAFAAAALFAVHPAKSETVSWVGCVPELSYTLLTLAAFYLYLKSQSEDLADTKYTTWALMSLAGLFFLAALLSKETAIVLPAIILAHELSKKGMSGLFRKSALRTYVPLAAGALVYFALRANALGEEFAIKDNMYGFLTPWQYVLTAASFFAGYMKMLVFPAGAYPFQVFVPVLSLAEPEALVSIPVFVVSAVLFIAALKRPAWAVAAVLIFLPLLPALYIPGMSRHPFAERYIYLPSAGFGLAAALMLQRFAKGRLSAGMVNFKTLAVIFSASSLLAVWTWSKNLDWRDDMTVWSASIAASPDNYYAHYSLGLYYFEKEMFDNAIGHSLESVKQNASREHKDVLIEVLARKTAASSYNKLRMYPEAIREYREILKVHPSDFSSNYNLAVAYQESGLFDDAIEWYGKALRTAKRPADARDTYNNLANCYVGKQNPAYAVAVYEEALNAFPGDELLSRNMAVVMRMSNQ